MHMINNALLRGASMRITYSEELTATCSLSDRPFSAVAEISYWATRPLMPEFASLRHALRSLAAAGPLTVEELADKIYRLMAEEVDRLRVTVRATTPVHGDVEVTIE